MPEHKSQAFKLLSFTSSERERDLNVARCDLESSAVSKRLLHKPGEKFVIPLLACSLRPPSSVVIINFTIKEKRKE